MECPICMYPIQILYYKGRCKCNVRYHYECIIKWYQYKKNCIICQKYDNIEINTLKYKYNKILNIINVFLYIFILFITYLCNLFYKNFHSLL